MARKNEESICVVSYNMDNCDTDLIVEQRRVGGVRRKYTFAHVPKGDYDPGNMFPTDQDMLFVYAGGFQCRSHGKSIEPWDLWDHSDNVVILACSCGVDALKEAVADASRRGRVVHFDVVGCGGRDAVKAIKRAHLGGLKPHFLSFVVGGDFRMALKATSDEREQAVDSLEYKLRLAERNLEEAGLKEVQS